MVINVDEYQMTLELLASYARQVRMLPLEEVLAALERADVLGPIVDPTTWRKAHAAGGVDATRRLLAAGLAFQREADAIVSAAGGDAIGGA